MFSGIIKGTGKILRAWVEQEVIRIEVSRPQVGEDFSVIETGDSIAVNGICLTVEKFDALKMQFALGNETLQITGWTVASLTNSHVNLEPSLKLGDRIHGHLVSGHVDTIARVIHIQDLGGSLQVDVEVPSQFQAYVWPKGSWAINGVSLTINWEKNGVASSCLIPETLLRTNLRDVKVGDQVTMEFDQYARGLMHFLKSMPQERGFQNEHHS